MKQRETVPKISRTEIQTGQGTAGIGPADSFPYAADTWQRVSMKYAIADFVSNLLWTALLTGSIIANYALNMQLPWFLIVALGVVALGSLISGLLAFRRTRSIGYILREDDILFRIGLLFTRTISVPYGRMQLVEVTQGPVLRLLGISKLRFVTAAAGAIIYLPGLEQQEAQKLRDYLLQVSETRRSGL